MAGFPLLLRPCEVEGFAGLPVASLHAGRAHSASVLHSGDVLTWGEGSEGKLGHGSTGERAVALLPSSATLPDSLPICHQASALAPSTPPHHCSLLVCLALRHTSPRGADSASVPQRIECLAGRVAVQGAALGRQHTLLLDSAGQAWAMGENREGQCGMGTPLEELGRQQRRQWDPSGSALLPSQQQQQQQQHFAVASAAAAAAAAAGSQQHQQQQRQGAWGAAGAMARGSAHEQLQDYLAQQQSSNNNNSWNSTYLKPFVEHRERTAELEAAVAMCVWCRRQAAYLWRRHGLDPSLLVSITSTPPPPSCPLLCPCAGTTPK